MTSPISLHDTGELLLPSPLQPFHPDWPGADKLNLFIKRDDLIHPVISGNKWRKLKYTFNALPAGCERIISFGGGFSNHLHACGFLCALSGLPFTAIVRGDYSTSLTPMLEDLYRWQADIRFVDKKTYKLRDDPDWLSALSQRYPGSVIIPEGGSQHLALKGVAEIVEECDVEFDHVIVPVGSGATLAGLITALKKPQSATGIAVLKGEAYLESLVENLLPPDTVMPAWQIHHQYHCGGYGKAPEELKAFCNDMQRSYNIPVEPVYSGKMFAAVKDMIANGQFSSGSAVLLVHTGGLQGAR
ncbi:1-aminocyclopropane-1-carboxylate deaminase/D-cysteine desulfhydrase [Alteromonas sp. RKMC-009]|uniref:1-aminocyclopropane-1-carboxylate deaminase/D-cysteine desulfhydrase n=1 Tax=Alteromonas sp. RKMC-009 TaxID=2267264 RepID=UPI000E6A7439|nr:pyridoxal-phosphate dependent enzyme [Alteromonas sp. RKMC-009]AYA65402.1 pyridoxal-phosphate dependent enzyme [Alteromonas sp. RKMC-009]